MIKAMYIL